jgi:hypothetical protein
VDDGISAGTEHPVLAEFCVEMMLMQVIMLLTFRWCCCCYLRNFTDVGFETGTFSHIYRSLL